MAKKLTSETDRVIWFIRHGESTWNVRQLVQGQMPGSVLTDEGHKQAEMVGAELADQGVTSIVSSDLIRSQETAAPLARLLGLSVHLDKGFRERCFGEAEGKPSATLHAELSGIKDGLVIDADAAPVGGESIRVFYNRVRSAIAETVGAVDGKVAIFTHGGVVRMVEGIVAGTPPQDLKWGPVENATILRCVLSPSTVAGLLESSKKPVVVE